MSILIVLVIGGITLIMVASVNDAIRSPNAVAPTAVLTSPLNSPASDSSVSGQSLDGTGVGTSSNNGTTLTSTAPCASGCFLDNMCGGAQSIIARFDPNAATRYYYPPDHPSYQTFRNAETLGQTNYYFCTTAQAESLNWKKAP